MQVNKIEDLDFYQIHEIISSNKITDSQKINFLQKNHTQIQKIIVQNISDVEFKVIMRNRPLRKFKPIKNSFTKRGDKILLAKTLGIEPNEVDSYIKNVSEDLKDIDKLNYLPNDKINAIKTYVYRHGSKDDIVTFLNYELRMSKNILSTLYRTLDYHTDGLADYFIRPIHRMSNTTLVRLYNVIDANINDAWKNNMISEKQKNEVAKWSLIRIYNLQNNSKLINAVKTSKILSH